jgi:uncharacterized membrane protein YdjX (TVP38/TMEM64 family)
MRKLVLLLAFVGVIAAFFSFGLQRYLSLDSLKENRDQLLEVTQRHYAPTVAAFIGIYILQTAFSLPGAAILTLAGGFLFGSVLGTVYVNLGATTGATLAFLAARYLFREWVEKRFGHRLGPVQQGFARDGFGYLLTLRLIPVFPFFLVNVLSGLTRVTLGTYVLATAFGIIPGSFVYAYAGRQLGTINSLAEIASPRVLVAFTLLGLLALFPVLFRRFVPRKS